MRQLRSVFAALMTFCLIIFAANDPLTAQGVTESETADPIGEFIAVSGLVTVIRPDGTLWVGVGDKVYVYDIVIASSAGAAEILYEDGTRMVVGPNSRLLVEGFFLDSAGEGIPLNSLQGSLNFSGCATIYREDTPFYDEISIQTYQRNINLSTSKLGIGIIKKYVLLSKTIYDDGSFGFGIPSVGYGHALSHEELNTGIVKINDQEINIDAGISEEQAALILIDDIKGIEFFLNYCVTVPLSQGQFDALVSFTRSIGRAAFRGSTLLQLLNGGNYSAVPEQLSRWNKSLGKVVRWLVERREDEIALWNS